MAADEFDDDDRPARRPRNSRDDDDDRPPRRQDRDDRDDYDDAPRRSNVAPHRGTVVLILGIVGVFCCGLCGLIAFILGLIDLGKMKKGEMDSSGQGLTMAGTIIGIVGFVLHCAGGFYFRANPNMFK